jgi:hypothetical protein
LKIATKLLKALKGAAIAGSDFGTGTAQEAQGLLGDQ